MIKKAGPTIKDVAKLAGVAVITVSRCINTPDKVSRDKLSRVQQAIAELGYVQNVAAKQLRAKRNNYVALIIPDIMNHFYAIVSKKLLRKFIAKNIMLYIIDYDHQENNESTLFKEVLKYQPAAIILATQEKLSKSYLKLNKDTIPPIIQFDRISKKIASSGTISIDNSLGGILAAQYLIGKGVDKITIISGRSNYVMQDRIEAVCNLAKGFNIDVDVIEIEFNKKNDFIDFDISIEPSQGYFLLNSDIAVTFMNKFSSIITQKDAERIVVFDRTPSLDLFPVKLPYIDYNVEMIVDSIFRYTMASIEGGSIETNSILVPPSLVIPDFK